MRSFFCSTLKMAVTGSAILVKDGQIPEKFSYEISGVHPRTAAGTSKSGKELILVTVDGRQAASKGMTQRELHFNGFKNSGNQ